MKQPDRSGGFIMDLRDFAQFHLPALEADEIRFNVQIAVLAAAAKESRSGVSFWTLGAPGHCAIQSPGRPILLGNVNEAECEELVRIVRDLDYRGVVGADQTPLWFVRHAIALGEQFDDPIPQRIHVLTARPNYPTAEGAARAVETSDAPLLFEWLMAFREEAVPHDPPPDPANTEALTASGRFLFWMNDGRPVSMAAISRRLRHTGAIAPVYTPPEHRGRGYAGSVTAALVDRLFAEGKTSACLYTDLRNPVSNRCYARIGFKPYCDSWFFLRAR